MTYDEGSGPITEMLTVDTSNADHYLDPGGTREIVFEDLAWLPEYTDVNAAWVGWRKTSCGSGANPACSATETPTSAVGACDAGGRQCRDF